MMGPKTEVIGLDLDSGAWKELAKQAKSTPHLKFVLQAVHNHDPNAGHIVVEALVLIAQDYKRLLDIVTRIECTKIPEPFLIRDGIPGGKDEKKT